MQIDFERDRGMLGLPPKAPLFPRPVKAVLGALLVFLLAVALGAVLQVIFASSEAQSEKSLHTQLRKAREPEEIRRLALLIRESAPQTAQGKMLAADALAYAADMLPEQALWQQEALANYRAARALLAQEIASVPDTRELMDANLGMAISGLLLDLGQDKEALAETENLKTKYETSDIWDLLADNHTNLLAYILSSARDPQVRDGKTALKIMDGLMTGWEEDDDLHNAAFTDTWAECNYAAGRPHRAVELQKQALTRAESRDLWVYIRHFRAYQTAANRIAVDAADPNTPVGKGDHGAELPAPPVK